MHKHLRLILLTGAAIAATIFGTSVHSQSHLTTPVAMHYVEQIVGYSPTGSIKKLQTIDRRQFRDGSFVQTLTTEQDRDGLFEIVNTGTRIGLSLDRKTGLAHTWHLTDEDIRRYTSIPRDCADNLPKGPDLTSTIEAVANQIIGVTAQKLTFVLNRRNGEKNTTVLYVAPALGCAVLQGNDYSNSLLTTARRMVSLEVSDQDPSLLALPSATVVPFRQWDAQYRAARGR